MATIIPIGEPVNDAERAVIAHLRDHGPASWTVLHNFEIGQHGERFEVDLAVLTPHAVYLIDVKGTRGLIEVDRYRWYPEGRAPFTTPLAKLRHHARTFKGLLTASNPGRRELEDVFVAVAVILSAPDAYLVDPDGHDAPDVTTLKQCVAFLSNLNRIRTRFSRNITPLLGIVRSLIQGKAKKRTAPLQFGNWIVTERLGSTDQYTEYRARNAFAGTRSGSVLLRVYPGRYVSPQSGSRGTASPYRQCLPGPQPLAGACRYRRSQRFFPDRGCGPLCACHRGRTRPGPSPPSVSAKPGTDF
jgi:hypothetical protein